MKASVDISIYPLQENFENSIKDFIRKLRKTPFEIIETPLSTQIYGDFHEIMDWLDKNLHNTFISEDHCVVSLKIIKGDRSEYKPFKD